MAHRGRPDEDAEAQAAAAVKPDQLAAVERIRARIEERAAKEASGAAKAYAVTIPNTTVHYDMAPIPGGEFTMGSTASPAEQPPHKVRLNPFWMQTQEVTWDAYLMFMFADQAHEAGHADAIVDALSPANFPLTNPIVLEKTLATRGDNLVKGMEHLIADLRKGQLTHTDPDAFEVGPEVRDAFLARDRGAEVAFRTGKPGKYMADLYVLARRRLEAAGVRSVHGGGFCTYHDAERFFSYRRTARSGRMGAFIWTE